MHKWMAFTLIMLLPCLNWAETYQLSHPNQDVVGHIKQIRVVKGDTLHALSLKHELGMGEIIQANPTIKQKGNLLTIDEPLILPTRYILPSRPFRVGIVVNIPERRLYYFHKNGTSVSTYPVALGRSGWRTPLFKSHVVRKKEAPEWNVPASIRRYTLQRHGRQLPTVVPPGPHNPLGDYAIYLQRGGILIHGTNDPSSIGRLVSSGCIRMYNHHVKALFEQVEIGTPVHIIHHPHKVGVHKGQVFLESHPHVSSNQKDMDDFYRFSVEQALSPYAQVQDYVLSDEAIEHAHNATDGTPKIIGYENNQTHEIFKLEWIKS